MKDALCHMDSGHLITSQSLHPLKTKQNLLPFYLFTSDGACVEVRVRFTLLFGSGDRLHVIRLNLLGYLVSPEYSHGICVCTHANVLRQLYGGQRITLWVGYFLSPRASCEPNWAFRLGSNHLYPLSHLTGPLLNPSWNIIITALHSSDTSLTCIFWVWENTDYAWLQKTSALIHRVVVGIYFRVQRVSTARMAGKDSCTGEPERQNWCLSRINVFKYGFY